MECDALFAESDDEVEVLPSTVETASTTANEQTPKPVSSNYVNSTTPNQSYEVNISSLSHPADSHTPVPEEYQPLPDSSSSIDYSFGSNNPDSTGGNAQRRIPDVNIRYQPKPHNHNYYYPNYYFPNAPRDYLYHNNLIVLTDNRNYLSHPLSYAMPNRTHMSDNHPEYQNLDLRSGNVYNQVSAGSNSGQPNGLERPSRKLNISPRRRQSKENETSNLIEVSSEEEDNVAAPRKKQRENCTENPADNGNGSDSRNENNSEAMQRVEVKGEPDEQTARTSDSSRINSSQNSQNTQTLHNPVQSGYNAKLHVKQENSGCGARSSCEFGANHVAPSSRYVYCHRCNSCHDRLEPCRTAYQSSANTSSCGESSSAVHVKEEPGAQNGIKQETSKKENTSPVSSIKMETLEPCQVKTEPGTTSSNSRVTVSVKPETDARNQADGGGDTRRMQETSPQPGTSSGKQDDRPPNNNQV